MPFNPSALNERTLKQFVDRLVRLRKDQPLPTAAQWPPKRSQIQEEVAVLLGFSSWHQAIHAIKTPAAVAPLSQPGHLIYPHEPVHWQSSDVDVFLLWASEQGASDVVFQTNESPYIQIHGQVRRVTKRTLTHDEVRAIANHLFKCDPLEHAPFMDAACIVRAPDGDHRRFRANVSPIEFDGQRGVQITLRVVASTPRALDACGLPETLRHKVLAVREGVIVAAGRTGDGKTTLISSFIQESLNQQEHRKIITYEAPIEFIYNNPNPSNSLAQTNLADVGVDLPQAVRNAMRRNPTDILVSECRDAETLTEITEAAMTGARVWTTLNSGGCADALRRMINAFPKDERPARALDILMNIKVLVCSRLVPGKDGKHIALFEYLVINDEVADLLIAGGLENLSRMVKTLLQEAKSDFWSDAIRKHKAGLISTETLNLVAKQSQAEAQGH